MPSNPSQTLEQAIEAAFGLKSTTVVNVAFVRYLLKQIDVRLKPLQEQQADLDAATDAVRQVGLDRINEILTPAIQAVLTIQERGFLIANSNSSNTLGVGNVLTFAIDDEDERAVFTPSKFLMLTRLDNADDWGIARLYSYNNLTGTLVCTVTAFEGDPGPHTDWQVSAVAGSTVAQMALLELMEALVAETEAAMVAHLTTAAGYVTAAAAQATIATAQAVIATAQAGIATTKAGEAATSKTGADAAAATSTAQAVIATTKAAEAAASAASIAGGPVTSVNLKTGMVFLDPTDVTTVVPTLDFDFTNQYGAPFDFLARATNGGYRQRASGLLVPTTTNEPVIDFSAGTALGTGFYGAYTNLLLRSEEFDNAAWSKTNVTVTANSVAGPDGATTMDTLDATAGGHVVYQDVSASPGTTPYTFSIFLKQGTAAATRIFLQYTTGGTTNYAFATLTWSTLTVSTAGSTATSVSYELKDIGGGIYRLSITGTNSGGANTLIRANIEPANSGNTGTAYAWGAQLTATAFPVPYVPTTSATVARNADVMKITGTDFTDFFNPVEGTLFVAYQGIPAAVSAHLVNITRNTGAYGPRLQIAGNGAASLSVVDDASAVVASVGGAAASGRAAFSFKANAFNAALNGAAGGSDTAGAMPTGLTALEIGRSPPGEIAANAYISRLIYWPKALTATDLQRMTA
jgi:hypothetical protein